MICDPPARGAAEAEIKWLMCFLFLCEIHHADKSRQQSRKHAWVHVPVHSALATYHNSFCLSEQSEILVLSLIKDAL